MKTMINEDYDSCIELLDSKTNHSFHSITQNPSAHIIFWLRPVTAP